MGQPCRGVAIVGGADGRHERNHHMITPRGIALVLVAVVVFVLAGATRVGWLLLFDAVLWGTLIVSAIMPWLATGGLMVRRRAVGWEGGDGNPRPMEGDSVEFEITLHNRGPLPCVFVSVYYNCEGLTIEPDHDRLFVAWLGRTQRLASTTKVTFGRRELHSLPQMRVESSVPFGLFRRAKSVGESAQLVVLPRVYPVARLGMLGKTGDSEYRPRAGRVGDQIAGSRTYSPGDPWQHIHWRNTARAAQPQVKEFEKSPDNSLVIAFDASQAVRNGGKALEHAVRIAASVADMACRSGVTVRLLAGRLDLGTSSRHHLLRELALLECEGEATLPVLLRERVPAPGLLALDVLAIVMDTDAEGMQALAEHARGGRRVTAVVFRGFESGSSAGISLGEIRSPGVPVVECRPDDVPGALAALEESARLSERTGITGVSGRGVTGDVV